MHRTTLARVASYLLGFLFLVAFSARPSHAQCLATGTSNTPYLVFGPQPITSPPTAGPAQTAIVTFSTTCETVMTVTISGNNINSNAGDFVLPDNAGSCPGATLTITNGKPSTCTLLETFAPTVLGTRTGSATLSWSATSTTASGTAVVNLIGGDEIVYATTGVGGQVLTVDGTTGAFQILSNGPGSAFNPTGAVVGPDAKIYITDSFNSAIWRMNQDGSQLEEVYSATCDGCPTNPEGPSFSASGNGDLYFNTFENRKGLFAIFGAAALGNDTFNLPVNIEPGTCDGCGGNGFPSVGTGTAFDANGNLLAADQDDKEIWSLAPNYDASVSAPAAILTSSTTTVGVSSSVVGIALNKAKLQTYFAQSVVQNSVTQNQVVQIVPPAGTGPYTTTTYSAFTSTNPGCQVNNAPLPDVLEYIAFDMTGHSFVDTSTSPLNEDNGPAQNGCGRVWRIDPTSLQTPIMLLDLSAVSTNGIAGVCSAPCGLNSTQVIGLAIPPTQSTPQFFSLPANGGSVTAGWPQGCTPPNPPTSSTPPLPAGCSWTITGTWPGGLFENPNDMLEVIFMEKTPAELAAEIAPTGFGGMGIMGAPVQGYGQDTIVASLQCVNTVNGTNGLCNDTSPQTQGTAYQMFSTWQSPQTTFCANPGGISGGMTYFFRGEPVQDVDYTSLENDLVMPNGCSDGTAGQKGQSSCSSTSSSSCLSRWWDGYGPKVTQVIATARIASPSNGAMFSFGGAATTTFSCSPSANPPMGPVVACPGSVTQPDGTLVSVSSLGTLPTSQVGTYMLTVTPDVNAVGLGQSAQITYSVSGFQFIGFDAPVTNSPVLNVATAGQAIPIAFQVLDANNNPVTNLTMPPVTIVFVPSSCSSFPTSAETDLPDVSAAGNSGFQNEGDGIYTYVWKTLKSQKGTCGQLQVSLGDGAVHTADFQFK